MKTPLRLLMIEDSAEDAGLVVDALEASDYEVTWERVETAEAMRAALEHRPWDIIISDYRMPQFSGPAALELLQSSGLTLPFIVVSGTIGEEIAVAMMKAGADDYLMKGRLTRLTPAVAHALADHRLRRQHQLAEAVLNVQGAALTATATPIIIADRTGAIIWVNPAFTVLTGYSQAEAIGKNPRELVKSGRQEDAFYEEMWATIFAGRVWRGELVNRRKDGSLYPEEMTITPVRDAAGTITHFIAVKQDLTERKLVEEMVQASRRQFQAVFEQAAVGMVISEGDDGRLLLVNRRFCEIVGYTEEELRQLTSSAITHPEDIAGDLDQQERVHSGLNRGFSRQKRFRKKDGTYVWTKVHMAPLDPPETRSTRRVVVIEDISVRRQAEIALRESETLLRESQSIAGLGSYALDVASGRWKGSDVLNWIFGIGPDYPHTVEGWTDLIHPEDRPMMVDYFTNEVLGLGRMFNKEYRIIRQTDREVRWVSGVGKLEFDAQGRVRRMVGTIQDITERKQADETLQREQALFSSLFSTIPDHIYFKDRQSRFIRINEAQARRFGLASPKEAIGKTDADIFSAEHARRAHADEQRIMETGEPMIGVEEKETWPDGRVTWVSTTKMPLRDKDGAITGLVGISRDITEMKTAERLLREQAEILAESHEGVMVVNLDNTITLWNNGAERIFGWTATEALGQPPEKMLGVDDHGAVSELRRAMERDGFWSGELRARTKDGRPLVIDCRTTLVRDEAGQPRARLNLISDVTEQKLLEEKFLHAQRLESVGMLAAGIAHDLNNVLAPIVFAAPMLRNNLSSERDLRILDTLESSAQRGAGLVKQILGFAHGTSGEFRPTQVKHLARDIMGVIEETFPKSIEFQHEIPSGLWPVQGNPTQIHQVLMNLCVNARDAMPQGGILRLAAVNRRIEASETDAIPGSRPGDWVVLTVADTGTGIAPEVVEKIWTPFFTTKGVGRGTGLGLTTIRSIVTHHRGFITLDTAVGRGTTFNVYLPALVAEEDRKKSAAPFAPHAGNGELILVVDDDAAIHSLVAAILKKFGYRVHTAEDGLDALTFFNTQPADVALVITDVDMPRIGGVALARTLLQIRADIPILAMSGLSHHDAASPDVPVIRNLAKEFLAKPFRAEELLDAVHNLLHPTPNV